MGQREGLSQYDLDKIRKMYECTGNYESSSIGGGNVGTNKPAGSKPGPGGGNLAGAFLTGLGNIVGALGKK